MRSGFLVMIAVICGFGAGALRAEPFPALYSVSGVAANDVLNVRAGPAGSSQKLGALDPDQRDVEVIAADPSGTWGQINLGERTAWVALRYLALQTQGSTPAPGQILTCFGTEPFWSLRVSQGETALFSSPETSGETTPAGIAVAAVGRPDRFVIRLGEARSAVIRRASCNDGMSDRQYGLEIDLIGQHGPESLLSGCCSVAAP